MGKTEAKPTLPDSVEQDMCRDLSGVWTLTRHEETLKEQSSPVTGTWHVSGACDVPGAERSPVCVQPQFVLTKRHGSHGSSYRAHRSLPRFLIPRTHYDRDRELARSKSTQACPGVIMSLARGRLWKGAAAEGGAAEVGVGRGSMWCGGCDSVLCGRCLSDGFLVKRTGT